MSGIRILGHGLSQGDEVISNFDLEKIVRTSDKGKDRNRKEIFFQK